MRTEIARASIEPARERREFMRSQFTLEFWRDGDFYVGRLREVPGVFSQGETMEELRENIQDAFDLMVTQERSPAPVRWTPFFGQKSALP
jgi:predicted RNase H-like HicB family nuclease